MAEPKTTPVLPLTGEQMTAQPTRSAANMKPIDTAQAMRSFDPATTQFGPGVPLTPEPGNDIRVRDYRVSENTVITPRAYETSMATLRALANIEPIRLAIETRKDQMESLQWSIVPKGAPTPGTKAKKANPATIEAMTAFWQSPNQVDDFATWLRALLEDLLVLDAPSLERRRTRGGGFGGMGKLIGLDVIPGDTIHPLIDASGRRPRDKTTPAFQQVIKGRPWVNLTNADLLYLPRNPRPGHNYGMSPVEQIVVTAHTVMRRQAAQLAYFTEGNTPAGFISGPEGWNADQVKAMQDFVDTRLTGNTAEQAKLLFMPFGAVYQAFKDSPLKDDFDEWLYRIVCSAFSLPPTAFIKSMNRSTAETDKERATTEGLLPLRLWFKRLADRVMREDFGITDHEWSWDDDTAIDPLQQAEIDDLNLRNGSTTHDEVRDHRGDAPYSDGVGAKPMIIMTSGAVLLEQAIEPPVEPPAPVHVIANPDGSTTPVKSPSQSAGNTPAPKGAANKGPKQAQGKTSGGGAKDTPDSSSKIAKSASGQIGVDRHVPRRAIKGLTRTLTDTLQAVGDDVAIHVARSLGGLHKASDADTLAAQAALAEKLAASADLDGLNDLVADAVDDLFAVFTDSADAGLAQVGVKVESDLVDRVDAKAVAYAKARAAELVSVDGDKNLIDFTRAQIRDVIANGLADNIGTPAIAKNIQESRAFSPERASTIANTEVRNANSQGVLESYRIAKDRGISIQKAWQTSNAGADCCDECVGNEDEGPIDLDDTFSSGDDAPTAHPGCQCVLTSVITTDDGAEEDADEE